MNNIANAFDAIGLTLAANNRQIGRTTLQKLIYFEAVTIPKKIKLKDPFFAYFHGPFNRDVAKSLEHMVFFDILSEHNTRDNHERYVYKVTPKGAPTIDRLESKFKQTLKKIKNLVEICDKSCKLNPNSLSFAAKVHYMFYSQKPKIKPMSEDALVNLGKSFDWRISKSDIKNGSKLLEHLKLASIQR